MTLKTLCTYIYIYLCVCKTLCINSMVMYRNYHVGKIKHAPNFNLWGFSATCLLNRPTETKERYSLHMSQVNLKTPHRNTRTRTGGGLQFQCAKRMHFTIVVGVISPSTFLGLQIPNVRGSSDGQSIGGISGLYT